MKRSYFCCMLHNQIYCGHDGSHFDCDRLSLSTIFVDFLSTTIMFNG